MDVLIIEDETLAAERLQMLIKAYNPDLNIVGCLESIEESTQWLQTKKHPDLIFLDIHLSDGDSFEIFKRVNMLKPVIFTTAYDHYALDAFRLFCIDYILKPVTAESLVSAIRKYEDLTKLTWIDYTLFGELLKDNFKRNYKDRFLGKIGQQAFFVPAEEVAYLFCRNKVVFLVDRKGSRFVINRRLENLEPLLDPVVFFRINRSVIVNGKSIGQVRPYFNHRLKILINGAKPEEELIVSRERVKKFKEWADY